MTAHVNVDGQWKAVPEVFANVGGTQKTVKEAYANVDGVWRRSYASLIQSATGGSISTVGGYRRHVFNSSGTFTVTSGSGPLIILTVDGGGNGTDGALWSQSWDSMSTRGGSGASPGDAIIKFYEYCPAGTSITVTVGGSSSASRAPVSFDALSSYSSATNGLSHPTDGAFARAIYNQGEGIPASSYPSSASWWQFFDKFDLGYNWGPVATLDPAVWPLNNINQTAYPGIGGGGGAYAEVGLFGGVADYPRAFGSTFGGGDGGIAVRGFAGNGLHGEANTGGGGGGGGSSVRSTSFTQESIERYAGSGGNGGSGKVIIMYPIQESAYSA